MDLFHILEEAHVILFRSGVYRQAKVYHRGEDLYANYGGGFVKLHGSGGTSVPKCCYLGLEGKHIEHKEPLKAPKWREKP